MCKNRFGKRQLDIICKDHKNLHTDGSFAVELHVSDAPDSVDQTAVEKQFEELVEREGTSIVFKAGDTILESNEKQARLLGGKYYCSSSKC